MLDRIKKSCMVVMLAAGMLLGATAGAQAVDFKAKGEWRIAFGVGDARFGGGRNSPGARSDIFQAVQRLRLQLDAVASENLSGRVWFEIGGQTWGRAGQGAALGADGENVIKVKNAFLDWIVPETDLKFRMGIQNVTLPNAAGGSSIIGATDVAGITASYQFTDEVGLTAFWFRPANDNYTGTNYGGNRNDSNYLDNFDLFGFSVPLTFDGVNVTPWFMYGLFGRNTLAGDGTNNGTWGGRDGKIQYTLFANPGNQLRAANFSHHQDYTNMFWVGLPIKLSLWDPLNVEFEADYGYVEGFGKDAVTNYKGGFDKRADSKRAGWLVKALVEYKMDWGVPGIFGWYASGDDGDIKNGSERMPSVKANQKFTSFLGAAGQDWYGAGPRGGDFFERKCSLAGTWGIGAQIRDLSFIEDLKHTLRVAYWGGTNDTSMVKYFENQNRVLGYSNSFDGYDGIYLTKNDGLLEFNVDNTYKIYDNLNVGLDFGYIVNMMDSGTWEYTRANGGKRSLISKRDAWKAQLTFNYTF